MKIKNFCTISFFLHEADINIGSKKITTTFLKIKNYL